MQPLLYVFFHMFWATIEGSLEQQGQSSYAELSHEACEFMAGVDGSVWSSDTDTMHLYFLINGLRAVGISLYSRSLANRPQAVAGVVGD